MLHGDSCGFGRAIPMYASRAGRIYPYMIRKLKSGEFRLYSRKKDAATGKRRNLGTFSSLDKAKQHEREVQYFKKH
jgi:hypothetical protein